MKRKILLGLTGSVASVLYEKLIGELSKLGDVSVILTEKSYAFIDYPRLCDAIRKAHGLLYTDKSEWTWFRSHRGNDLKWKKNDPILHIDLRDQFSAFVIAPCSANTMAKIANGICDNLLTSVARAWDFQRPFIVAPAMNTQMWEHPVTKEHTQKLYDWGIKLVEPQSKMLACNTEGIGALAEIDSIVEKVSREIRWYFPIFPLHFSGVPVGRHPGAFSTQRKHEKHTGVDIYCEENAPVYAVESGTVVNIEHFTGEWDGSPWWENTDCIMIEGATGVVCYGEVEVSPNIVVGKKVKIGQRIAVVKRVLKKGKERPDIPGHSTSMLHMELYPFGTRKASNGFEEHLLNDPTPFLLEACGLNDVKKLTYDGPECSCNH
jgi:phosphopantothenoylcysteine decarboxylase